MPPAAGAPPGRRLPFGLTDTDDVALAAALIAVGQIGVALGASFDRSGRPWLEHLLVVALFAPLAWRTVNPGVVALAVAVSAAALWIAAETDWHTALAGGIAIFGLGRYLERPRSLRWLGAVLAVLVPAAALTAVSGDAAAGWFSFVARIGLVAAAFWYGDGQQVRDQLVRSLQERTERAEEHRRVVERQAVLDERNRIARELHDVVAHSLGVMVVQAGAAQRLALHDPEAAAAAMTSVADVGRSAMGEMRQILGLLDDDSDGAAGQRGAGLAPQPRLSDLAPLIERYRSAGLPVTVERPDDLLGLTAAAQLAVVRIVQEGLTNVLKHAPGTVATVRLVCEPAVLRIEISNDGGPRAGDEPTGGGRHDSGDGRGRGRGRGLVGMEQRVTSLGGTLVAGPDGTGFTVVARLPLDERTLEAEEQPA